MKKLVVFAVLGLFLSAAAFAEIIVLQDGKTVTYESENTISISGQTSASVLYNGVRIFVPKGKKVQISKAKDGNILVTGASLEGVELSNGKQFLRLQEGSKAVSVVPSTLNVSNLEAFSGTTKATEQTKAVKQNVKAVKAVKAENKNTGDNTVEFPAVSEYVNEVVTQQTAQDVTENPELSPSSPSSI